MGDRSRVDHYEVIRTLGRGASAVVRLVRDTNTDQQYAMKILKANSSQGLAARFEDMTANEVNVIKNINHPNIVNLVATSEAATYVKKQGKGSYDVMYIVMELCPNGELFEVLFQTGKFEETLARSFFQQIVAGLEAVHQSGQSHRDMKPENLLFDSNFNLKIADFGFAIVLSGRDGSGMLHTHLGTESYMAPEIHTRTPYKGEQVDMFAAGIILFIMMSQNPPFGQANPNDPYYKLLYTGNARFWALHGRNKPQGFYSDDFKDFITKMLALEPATRLNTGDMKAHAWFNGPTVSKEDLMAEIAGRRGKVEAAAEAARQAKEARMAEGARGRFGGTVHATGNAYRSGEGEQLPAIPTELKEYTGDMSKFSEFFSTSTAEELWYALSEYFGNIEEAEVALDHSADEFKMKAVVKRDLGSVEANVNITQAGDLRAVTFNKLNGNTLDFMKLFNDVNEKMPDLADGVPAN